MTRRALLPGPAATLCAGLLSLILAAAGNLPAHADAACRLDPLPERIEVHAVSAMRQSVKRLVRFGGDVVVANDVALVLPKTEHPIVLALSASAKTVWTVTFAPGARLAGVVFFGSWQQGVSGADEGTPMLLRDKREQRPLCRALARHIDVSVSGRKRANETIRNITGRDIAKFHVADGFAKIFLGDPSAHPTGLSTAQTALGFTPYVPADLPPGRAGLDRLVSMAKLRHATEQDVLSWEDRAAAAKADGTSALSRTPLDRIYVLTGPVTLPEGLIGSHAVTFLIAADAPLPDGPRGDSFFYSMNDFSCHPHCGREQARARKK